MKTRLALLPLMLTLGLGFAALFLAIPRAARADSPTATPIFINEIHYDNTGADAGEAVEIAGPTGSVLTGWSVELYNGSNGQSYGTIPLSGSIADLCGGFGALSFAFAGIQNGAPDGLALVDASSTVIQFLSYEGVMTATNGPASGMTSVDIGVSENGAGAVGSSLQLGGTGTAYADFAWQAEMANTFGACNTGQTFGTGGPAGNPDLAVTKTGPGQAAAPGLITYTIAISNTGNFTASGVTLTDTLPISASYVSDNSGIAPANPSAGVYTWEFGEVLSGTAASFVLTVTLEGGIPHGTMLTNTVSITTTTAGDPPGNNTDSALTIAFNNLPPVFINELHYDNTGADSGEAVEIAGPAGSDLTGWSVVLYDGGDSQPYATIPLSGAIPDLCGGYGVLSFAQAGIQNGAPDGLALVDQFGVVVQFLSYEGLITAAGGPASGMTSVDIGVSENGAGAVGNSLQLGGTGTIYMDFAWQAETANTFGACNTGQTFGTGGPAGNPDLAVTKNALPLISSLGTLTYTISLANTGNFTAENVTLTDTLPISATYLSDDSGFAPANPSAGVYTWAFGEVLSGTAASFVLTVTLEDGIPHGTMLTNTVSITTTTAGDPPGNNTDSAATLVFTEFPPVIINELDSDTPSTDILEFIELYDGGLGNTDLTGLVVVLYNGSDDLSYTPAIDLDGFSTDADGYFVIGNAAVPGVDLVISDNVIQNGADAVALLFGDAASFPNDTALTTLNLLDALVYDTADPDDPALWVLLNPGQPQVDEDGEGDAVNDSLQRCPNAAGGERNTATYTPEMPTPGAANNCLPDLGIVKTGPALAAAGDTITYTISYTNAAAGDAADTLITDLLPAGLSYLSDDSGLPCPACLPGATGTLTWEAGTILSGSGGSWNLVAVISGTLPLGAVLTNSVAITNSIGEINPLDNESAFVTMLIPLDLTVEKTGPASGVLGGVVIYQVLVEARGVISAPNTLVTETLPLSATYVADDSGVTPANPQPGIYVWNFGDLPAGALVTFNLTMTVDGGLAPGTTLTNTVSVSTASPVDPPANNSAQASTTVYPLVSIFDIQFVPDPSSNDASPYAGQAVWVEGIVTAEPGEIDTGTRLMVIQMEGGGAWSGLPVFNASGLPPAAPGSKVRILGVVNEFFGLTELVLTDSFGEISLLSAGNPLPAPAILTTSDFDDLDATASEPWEAVLIEFQNADVTDASLGFGEWQFDDGSGAARADDLGEADGDMTYLPELGDHYQFIRGIGFFSFGNYKLIPRDNLDVGLLDLAPVITKDAPAQVAPGGLLTYTLTIENALGYALLSTTITDAVPANTAFAYALDGGSESGGVVTWNGGALPHLGTLTVRFVVTATGSLAEIWNTSYGVTASNYPTPTLGAPVLTFVDTALHIRYIQGADHVSPLEGRAVENVPGIVTAIDTNGFYLQDPAPDADDATSEGIFVFTGSAPAVAVGDALELVGTVSEFLSGNDPLNLPTTEIINASWVILSSGNPLPAPVIIGNGGRVPPTEVIDDDGLTSFDEAADGIDFYESLEGMLVVIHDAQVVASTNSFGEITVVGDAGANGGAYSPRGGIVIQAGDFNPERLILADGIIFAEPEVLVGDQFTVPITGVVGYDFGNFKIFNTAPLPAVIPGGLVSETTSLAPDASQLSVATFNVENLDPSDDRFDELADQIVNHLNSPDILVLEEVQDNSGAADDGTVSASQTYAQLIAAISDLGGPAYAYAQIDPLNNADGGQPGGNIRVGFLYRTDRGLQFIPRPGGTATTATAPTLVGGELQLTFSPGRIDPNNAAFTASRKPLVGEFEYNGHKLFIIGVHLNSKGGDTPLFGSTQPPAFISEAQRVAQAQIIHDFVASALALDSQANIIVAGDFNDFQFSTALAALKGSLLTNAIDSLPPGEQYTYIFEGNGQALDHILLSDNLALMGFEHDIVHMNAEMPTDLQVTDHDPQLALITLPAPSFQLHLPIIIHGGTGTSRGPDPIGLVRPIRRCDAL